MDGWKFTFPASRTCLWDSTPCGQSTELHITRNSWLCVCVSPRAVQLAVRHARQTPRKHLLCLLIGTAWITEGEGMTVDVDRFDPGKTELAGSKVLPTALVPGEVGIACQVIVDDGDTKFLTHNLKTLQDAFDDVYTALSRPVDPASFLSLRIHCTSTKETSVHIQCGCVIPRDPYIATPINAIPIVQTALARNLSGPLPVSALQGRPRHGYLTMESSRKLVLLLHSDPKAATLPLVGIWVSGVNTVYHPLVWAASIVYSHSNSFRDRVWGDGGTFLVLVYRKGATSSSFWQCAVDHGEKMAFEMHAGERMLELLSDLSIVQMELFPVQESSALHTLITAASQAHTPLPTASQAYTPLPTASQAHTPLPTASQAHTPLPTALQAYTPLPTALQAHTPLPTTSQAHTPLPTTSQAHTPLPTASQAHTPLPTTLQAHTPLPTTSQAHTPLPSPHPTPSQAPHLARDSELSYLSLTEEQLHSGIRNDDGAWKSKDSLLGKSISDSLLKEDIVVFPGKRKDTPSTEEILHRQELQLKALQDQVNALLSSQSPRCDASTSTGESLLWDGDTSSVCVSGHEPVQYGHVGSHEPVHHGHVSSHEPVHHGHVGSHEPVHHGHVGSHEPVQYGHISSHEPVQYGHISSHEPVQYGHVSSHEPVHRVSSHEPVQYGHVGSHDSVSPSSPCESTAVYSTMSALSLPTASSLLSQSSTDMIIDMQSYAHTTSSPPSSSLGESASVVHQHSGDQQRYYQTMLAQVQDLLQLTTDTENKDQGTVNSHESSEHRSTLESSPPHTQEDPPVTSTDTLDMHTTTELSILPVPRIICPGASSTLTDCTMDGQLTDMIAVKYSPNPPANRQALPLMTTETTLAHMSMATGQYMKRHNLLRPQAEAGGNILDIRRLKALPKLI